MTISKERKKQIRFAVKLCMGHLEYYELSLPLMVNKIPKALGNCILVPYSTHMKKFDLSYEEMIMFAESYDACTDYNALRDRYIIYYNDVDKNKIENNRYRWNIAHELGHICLNHLTAHAQTRVFRSNLSSYDYSILEEEADCFAAYLLVPHVGLYASHISTPNELKNVCKISTTATTTRYSEYLAWFNKNNHPSKWDSYDRSLAKTYSIAKARKGCASCNYILYDNFAKYCPICGSNLNYTLEETMAKYPGIELNQHNRPNTCFNCDNEEHLSLAEYCMICGESIINTCTNDSCTHGHEAYPGNARYCPYCGSKTTYFEKGYLEEFNRNDAIVEQVSKGLVGFQVISDEDIPF